MSGKGAEMQPEKVKGHEYVSCGNGYPCCTCGWMCVGVTSRYKIKNDCHADHAAHVRITAQPAPKCWKCNGPMRQIKQNIWACDCWREEFATSRQAEMQPERVTHEWTQAHHESCCSCGKFRCCSSWFGRTMAQVKEECRRQHAAHVAQVSAQVAQGESEFCDCMYPIPATDGRCGNCSQPCTGLKVWLKYSSASDELKHFSAPVQATEQPVQLNYRRTERCDEVRHQMGYSLCPGCEPTTVQGMLATEQPVAEREETWIQVMAREIVMQIFDWVDWPSDTKEAKEAIRLIIAFAATVLDNQSPLAPAQIKHAPWCRSNIGMGTLPCNCLPAPPEQQQGEAK
jgi:hypothetical protein